MRLKPWLGQFIASFSPKKFIIRDQFFSTVDIETNNDYVYNLTHDGPDFSLQTWTAHGDIDLHIPEKVLSFHHVRISSLEGRKFRIQIVGDLEEICLNSVNLKNVILDLSKTNCKRLLMTGVMLDNAEVHYPDGAEVSNSNMFSIGAKSRTYNVKSDEMKNIYVNAITGSDTEGDGSYNNPFKTYKAALSTIPLNDNKEYDIEELEEPAEVEESFSWNSALVAAFVAGAVGILKKKKEVKHERTRATVSRHYEENSR